MWPPINNLYIYNQYQHAMNDIFEKYDTMDPATELATELASKLTHPAVLSNVPNVSSEKKYKLISPVNMQSQQQPLYQQSQPQSCHSQQNPHLMNANNISKQTEQKTTNTEQKCRALLSNLKPAYGDKQCLQEMLDETIDMLKRQEDETYKLKVRCREYQKMLEKQHNRIRDLDHTVQVQKAQIEELNELIESNEYNKDEFRMQFLRKYT